MELRTEMEKVRLKKNKKSFQKMIPYLFISPWLIGFTAFTLGPLLLSFYMSFHDWPVIGEATFVGLRNYVDMFHLNTDTTSLHHSLPNAPDWMLLLRPHHLNMPVPVHHIPFPLMIRLYIPPVLPVQN